MHISAHISNLEAILAAILDSSAPTPLPLRDIDSLTNNNTNFDLKRLESLMEGMTRSVNALVGRVNVLDKGPPSQEPKVMVKAAVPTRPCPWGLPPPARAGPSSARPESSSASAHSSFPPLSASLACAGPSSGRPGSSAQPPAPKPGPSSAKQDSSSNGPRPSETFTPSLNPDFSKMCKSLYYVCQLRRHMENWQSLPASIHRNLKHMASNIKPIHPSDELVQDISSLFSRTGDDLRDRVSRHFVERMEFNLTTLRKCNPLDWEQAVDVVTKQITHRLGGKGKVLNLRSLVEGEAKAIWAPTGRVKVNRNDEGRGKVNGDDTGDFRKPTNPAKKLCLMSTPPTTATSNSFSALADLDEGTVEPNSPPILSKHASSTTPKLASSKPKPETSLQSPPSHPTTDSPSPSRKTSRYLPKTPISPRTPVSFTPLTHARSKSLGPNPNPNTDPIPTPTSSSTTAVPRASTATPSPPTSSTLPPRYSLHSGNDKASWKVDLRPDTLSLIISDSNFKHLSESDIPAHVQLESFSGANYRNTLNLISKLPDNRLDNLVISIGINHKDELFKTRTAPAMTIFMETCAGKAREITAVGVSINPYLAEAHRDNLSEINNRLQHITHNKYVKPLSSHQINTGRDMVHYTRETQLDILHRILQQVNTTPKN